MTKYEQQFYEDIKRIAKALEKIVAQNALIASDKNTSILTAKEILETVKIITDDYTTKQKQ